MRGFCPRRDVKEGNSDIGRFVRRGLSPGDFVQGRFFRFPAAAADQARYCMRIGAPQRQAVGVFVWHSMSDGCEAIVVAANSLCRKD